MTDAHSTPLTLRIMTNVPEHEPRESDPHYHLFNEAKARIKKQGLWKCAIADDLCSGQMELHHSYIEFSQINNTDPVRLEHAFGVHFANDEDFQKWLESPDNLEVLCEGHHRTHFGIHSIPAPLWQALRFRKVGTAPAAEHITKG